MTMPPSGIKTEMDEEAVIEAEIRQQLELMDLENEDANNNIDDVRDNILLEDLEDQNETNDEEMVVDEAKDYLSRLQKQTERFENELNECDDLLNYYKPGDNGMTENFDELVEAAETSGIDPQELRKKILEAINKEDEAGDAIDGDLRTDTEDTSQSENSVFVTSETEHLPGKQEEVKENAEEFEESLILDPGDGVVALVDEIQTQEEFFKQQLRDMEVKYRERDNKRKQEAEVRRKEEEEKENEENAKRQLILQRYAEEKEALEEQTKIAQQKLDVEVEEKRKIIQDEVKKFEEQITLLESETRREQEELEKSVHERQEKQKNREEMAAKTLQAGFRGYRVRKTSQPVLHQKREERAKEKEQKRIEEVERDIEEKKEAKAREEEELKRIEEEKQEEEEEKRIREEKAKLEEERKQKEKKLEEERKKREEIKLAEEKRKKEEEEKRIQKKKEEAKLLEEKKRKEEERIENERKERKRIEAERIEREKREQEEKERKEEEERLKKEEERKVQEEREKEQKLEEERLKEEQRLREENERLKEELRKIKETNADSNDDPPVKETDNTVLTKVKNKTSEGNDMTTKDIKSASEIKKSISEKRQQFEKTHAQEEDSLGRTLPQHIEAKRLAWIKECLPWSKISNEPWKLKGGVSKKPPRRPSSAKKLPALAEDVIRTAARVATLKQVTTVQLSDLPGCNLSTLGQCWGLKSLTMTNCSLVALDSLQQCKQLQYLCVKRNKLEYIDLKDLGNLQFVDLSSNNLSVVHGLDGCTNIRWLDLSCNRVTRLGGLDPLRRLHTLLLSSNQLITCSGISDVPTLQHLDLSNNHLQELDGLHKLCLLQRLNVSANNLLQKLNESANNLLQFPDVRNQVLLEECDLSDNSISSLDGLTSYWLPMLTKLNISKNSLTELDVLDNLILLMSLDVSNNQLLDLETVLSPLSCLVQLEELSVLENPATDGTAYKERLHQILPRLRRLDGEGMESREDAVLHAHTDFEAMCRTHAHFHNSIRNTFLQELQSIESNSPVDDLGLCEAYFRYCDKSFKLAVEHRYAHEYGEISMNIPVAPSTPKSGRPRSARAKILHPEAETYLSPKEMFEKALKSDSQTVDTGLSGRGTVMDNPKDLFEKALKSGGSGVTPHHGAGLSAEDPKKMFEKALETQAGKQTESGKDAFEKAVQNVKPSTEARIDPLPTAWPGNSSQNDVNIRASLQNLPPDELAILEELHSSATKIQALWRGYILRLKLAAALDYARMVGEDDTSELDDFNMDDITFDEESLEKGWRPTETPQIPHSHPVLGKPPTGRPGGTDVLKLELAPVHPPNRPRHAWRNMDSPLSDLAPHPPRPPSSIISASDTHRTGGLSKREEKLAEEWGFHNSRTAELMLQRAKKMKLNSDRKRKLSRLDPKQRLALFRKLEEVTKLSPIHAPVRKTLPRKEYFQAREEEVQRQEFEKRREAQTRTNRTYEWLHTQVASLDTPAEREVDRHGNFGSEGNLAAAATAEILGSYRMQVMQQAGYDTDIFGKGEQRARRFSSGESISTSGQTTYLPPIKTNSAGSNGSNSGGRRKEKMSWRNKPAEVDVGWGGGRKRQTNK